jgi:hypothetical protein
MFCPVGQDGNGQFERLRDIHMPDDEIRLHFDRVGTSLRGCLAARFHILISAAFSAQGLGRS